MEYEVTVRVEGMEYPVIGTLTIAAESAEEAKEWVLGNLSLTAEKI